MKSTLDIIIVNWNTGSHLADCLASIAESSDKHVELGRVVVVDNASTDDSLPRAEDYPFELLFIHNKENRGFGAACNQGAEGSASDFVLFLNPDMVLKHETLDRVLAFAQLQGNAGITGIKLTDADGQPANSCFRFPSPFNLFLKATGLEKLPGLRAYGHRMIKKEGSTSETVSQVIGAFFLVRHELFEKLHGFDERFFMYFEEVDFCRRAKIHGWETWYFADAEAVHVGTVSSSKIPAHRLAWSWESRLRYARKHMSFAGNLLVLLSTVVFEPLARILQALVSLQFRKIFHVTRAVFLLCLPSCGRKIDRS